MNEITHPTPSWESLARNPLSHPISLCDTIVRLSLSLCIFIYNYVRALCYMLAAIKVCNDTSK